MREILFKAKRIDYVVWLEIVPFDVTPLTGFSTDSVKKEIVMVRAGFADWGMPRGIEGASVDPETVCQYTGLTDRNGVKVFEGDILKFTDEFNGYEWIGRMEFGNPNAGYIWAWQRVHLSGEDAHVDTLCWFDMEESGAYSEVIGNIHDKEK